MTYDPRCDSDPMFAAESDVRQFGACCACGATDRLCRNIVMLHRRAPQPGSGWGCLACCLPLDGAYAVVCDPCVKASTPIINVVVGDVASGERIAVELLLSEPFEHDLSQHPEETEPTWTPPYDDERFKIVVSAYLSASVDLSIALAEQADPADVLRAVSDLVPSLTTLGDYLAALVESANASRAPEAPEVASGSPESARVDPEPASAQEQASEPTPLYPRPTSYARVEITPRSRPAISELSREIQPALSILSHAMHTCPALRAGHTFPLAFTMSCGFRARAEVYVDALGTCDDARN